MTAARETPGTHGAQRRIALVIEDDLLTQSYMERVLHNDFDVLIASSGAEARAHLAAHGERTCVILMDLSLQGDENGVQLTRALRAEERWKTIPIIATTAHAFPEDERNSLEAGCSAYLAKPIEPARLLATIRRFVPAAGGVARD